MAKMTGLGKGLDALFANNIANAVEEEKIKDGESVEEIEKKIKF